MQKLEAACGCAPNLEIAAKLYRPALPHEQIAKVENELRSFRISVEGVVVRYVGQHRSVHLTVEGELPEATIRALVTNFTEKLSVLENTTCEARPLGSATSG